MRADMAKVIVERPRKGSHLPSRKKGYRKFVQQTGVENLPTREPMLGLWHGRGRHLNEHLGPMRRFLRSNVGRPWNKVHQELCEHVSFDNAVQSHVLSHIFQYVHERVDRRCGVIVSAATGYWRGYVLSTGEMYVCPTSGLLKVARKQGPPSLPTQVGLGNLQQSHWRDGVWWKLTLRPFEDHGWPVRRHAPTRPSRSPRLLWDVWLERWMSLDDHAELTATYGGKLIVTSKRLLDRAETGELTRRLQRKNRFRRSRPAC
jgi:hypothetical protein